MYVERDVRFCCGRCCCCCCRSGIYMQLRSECVTTVCESVEVTSNQIPNLRLNVHCIYPQYGWCVNSQQSIVPRRTIDDDDDDGDNLAKLPDAGKLCASHRDDDAISSCRGLHMFTLDIITVRNRQPRYPHTYTLLVSETLFSSPVRTEKRWALGSWRLFIQHTKAITLSRFLHTRVGFGLFFALRSKTSCG